MKDEIEIKHTSHEVIERKLLAALDEGDQVAILATREDLDIIIAGLEAYSPWARPLRRQTLLHGLRKLREEAFS